MNDIWNSNDDKPDTWSSVLQSDRIRLGGLIGFSLAVVGTCAAFEAPLIAYVYLFFAVSVAAAYEALKRRR